MEWKAEKYYLLRGRNEVYALAFKRLKNDEVRMIF